MREVIIIYLMLVIGYNNNIVLNYGMFNVCVCVCVRVRACVRVLQIVSKVVAQEWAKYASETGQELPPITASMNGQVE